MGLCLAVGENNSMAYLSFDKADECVNKRTDWHNDRCMRVMRHYVTRCITKLGKVNLNLFYWRISAVFMQAVALMNACDVIATRSTL